MRTIHTNEIKTNIKEMCIEANYVLSQDVAKRIYEASESEENEIGKKILNQLIENMDIAKKEMIPICQDTGMTTVFIEVGQDVHFEGDFLENAINDLSLYLFPHLSLSLSLFPLSLSLSVFLPLSFSFPLLRFSLSPFSPSMC